MLGSFVVLDLLVFFVFFEVVLLPMWFADRRLGRRGALRRRSAAANRFILYTLLGSALMLVGFLLVLGEHRHPRTWSSSPPGTAAGCRTGSRCSRSRPMLAGFAIKTPMWPLHTWLPGAHTAAPTVGSVLLAGVLLKMGTYGLVRTALPVTPEGAEVLAPYLGVLGVVGIVYGSLACLGQRDLKRLIAYSRSGTWASSCSGSRR